MKITKIMIATLAVAAFVGCNHTDDGGNTPAPAGIEVRVEAGASESTKGTRTEYEYDDNTKEGKTTWSNGDEIRVAAFKNGSWLVDALLSTTSTEARVLLVSASYIPECGLSDNIALLAYELIP